MSTAISAMFLGLLLFQEPAQTDDDKKDQEQKVELYDEVVVIDNAIGELGLDRESSTGSRLGLELLEIPASVEVMDSAVMQARGYLGLAEAVESLPGVVSGESPAAPSSFSMRGFTRSQITILRDGLWLGSANMVMRPQNTFNLERVEVLRGPSSVLNGQGAVAGTINAITRSATANSPQAFEVLASYGRFDTYQLGIGASGAISDSLFYRADISQYGSDGYVDRMDPESLNATGSLLFQASDSWSLEISLDYLTDDLANYWGTPLVPAEVAREPLPDVVRSTTGETVDHAMRFRNYNVADYRADSEQILARADLNAQLSSRLALSNTLYGFDAQRDWLNAEGFVYCTEAVDVCTTIGEIQRYYGYFFVGQNQDLLGDRFTLEYDHSLGRMENRFLGGFEITDLDLTRERGFRRNVPLEPGDSVDPYDPVPGLYGPRELRGTSPTTIDTRALFVEDALAVSERFSLVTALRYEELDLDRKNFDGTGQPEASGFARHFAWWSWRVGGVFNMSRRVAAYAQYSNAKDPVNTDILLVDASENFDLTDAEQWEVGLKSLFLGGRAQATVAWFDITRDDILERIGLDSATNVGGRSSNGLEVSATLRTRDHWRVGANGAYTDAEFDRSPNFHRFAGNTPPNVPEITANLWLSYRDVAALPLEIGTSARYVDDRLGDNENTVTLGDYLTSDLFASWDFGTIRLTGRVTNLTDEEYASWSDIYYLHQNDPSFLYANQILLGSPRSYEMSVRLSF